MLPSAPLAPGTLVGGDFRVIRPLARGGMGMLYVVEQVSVGAERALKVMHGRMAADPRLRERFLQEARASAKIESDHVVQVIAAGVDDASGTPWMVQELLRGEDLSVVMERRTRLEIAETLEVFRQLCHALGAAHRAGLVHRDLKPENIFLAIPRREGSPFTVKLLDFGIAKFLEESATGQAPATTALGSPLWMAPEQAQKGHVSPGTDVWALGLVAFFLLTGRTYWFSGNREDGNVQQVLREIFVDPIEPASARAVTLGAAGMLPTDFDDWFARCVARDPGARYRDATEALAHLTPVLINAGAAAFSSVTPPPLPGPATLVTPGPFDPAAAVPVPSASGITRRSLPPPPAPWSPSTPPPSTPPPSTPPPSRPPPTVAWMPEPAPTPIPNAQIYPHAPPWSQGGPSAPLVVPPPPPPYRPPVYPVVQRPVPRRGTSAWLVVVALVILGSAAAVAAWWLLPVDPPPPQPPGGQHPVAAHIAPPPAASLAVGWGHSCALAAEGTVTCWGQNRYGQLGDGTVRDRHHASAVSALTSAVEVSAGFAHTCARMSDGTVRCWGSNASGQLGDGTLTSRDSPVTVAGLAGAAQVTLGEAHSCARITDGTVRCWGRNERGQLGTGDTVSRVVPAAVPGLTEVVQLALGSTHTCALRSDGTVRCWGANDQGQLGLGPLTDHPSPVTVPGLAGVVLVAAGGQRTGAVLTGGAGRCWGRNDVGQLGDGTTTGRAAPVALAGIESTVASLALAPLHTCARMNDGTVRCWGSNAAGELGDGTTAGHPLPVPVTGLTDVTDLALADGHACARRTDGTVLCWGWNAMGQLGNGATMDSALPVATVNQETR